MPKPAGTARKPRTDIPETCPKCNGYGWAISSDGVATPCDCGINEQRRGGILFRNSEIPPRFRDKDLKNYKAERGDRVRTEIRHAAAAYAATFHQGESYGLVLRGVPGSGKTHVAIAILKSVIERGFRGYYANFNDLLSRIRDSYQSKSVEPESQLLAEIDGADLLVLDDVGAEVTTDWVRDRLYLIINRRYENAKATIVTTNCDEAELEARIGPRTASRLYEMCSRDFPPFPHQDYRKAAMR